MRYTELLLDIISLCVTVIGLLQATAKVWNNNKPLLTVRHWVLFGMYFFFILYILFIMLSDLGYGEFEIPKKIMFLLFTVLAIPWSSGFDFNFKSKK